MLPITHTFIINHVEKEHANDLILLSSAKIFLTPFYTLFLSLL